MNVNLKGVFLGCKYGIRRCCGPGRLDREHRLLRGGDGRRDVADRLHRQQGGVLAMTAGDRGRVRAAGHPAPTPLCPGPVNTPLLQELLADPAARARRLVHVPWDDWRRRVRSARAVLFLASEDASYVNGSTFSSTAPSRRPTSPPSRWGPAVRKPGPPPLRSASASLRAPLGPLR